MPLKMLTVADKHRIAASPGHGGDHVGICSPSVK